MTTSAPIPVTSDSRYRPLSALLEQLPDRLRAWRQAPTLPPNRGECLIESREQFLSTTHSEGTVRYITGNSREVSADTLFVAVPGIKQDGHRFIPQAIAAGAVAVVGSHPPAMLAEQGWWTQTDVPFIQVTDSREALAYLSAALFDFPSRAVPVIGVTGTDGKTTTCFLLEAILSQSADVGVITSVSARLAGVEQDTGLHVTTPEAPMVQAYLAQMQTLGCGYAIIESTSFGLDQKRVAAVDYDVAAVTNITHEHLDIHGSYEAYQAAKALLFRSLFRSVPKPDVPRIAVLNRDDISYQPLQAVLAEEQARNNDGVVTPYTYSMTDSTADVYARQIEYWPDITRFDLVWPRGAFPLETRLIGAFNVSNILCAAAAALGLGIPPAQIQQGVASLLDVLGRMQRMDVGQDFLAVVDFAHSPVSLERALETLRPLVAKDGRLIAIFGSAGLRDRGKRRLMGQVSGRLADFTIITAEDPRQEDVDAINREIAAGVQEYASPERFAIVPDRAEAIHFGVQMARNGDVVASFGKGHERSMCFGKTEYPWNEQEAMLSALRTYC